MARKRSLNTKSTCTVCLHPERHQIEMLRVAGASLDSIATKFTLKRDAIWRHMRHHVSDDEKAIYLADVPLREMAERAAAEGVSLLNYFQLVRSTVFGQMLLAASTNDGHRTAVLAGRAVDVLREIGKLTGELIRAAPVTNITNNIAFVNHPAFVSLQEMLLQRLAGHPEALAAVIDGLRELEDSAAPPRVNGRAMMIEGEAHAVA